MAGPEKSVWQAKLESATTPVAIPSIDVQFTNMMLQLQGKSSVEAAQEAERNKLGMEMLEAKARAEQELAIADRIRTAVEVEIIDYYDVSGHGSLGVDVQSQNVGMQGGGQKISHRIVRLKGFSSL